MYYLMIDVVKNRNRTVCLNVPFLTGSGVVQQKYHLKLVMEAVMKIGNFHFKCRPMLHDTSHAWLIINS